MHDRRAIWERRKAMGEELLQLRASSSGKITVEQMQEVASKYHYCMKFGYIIEKDLRDYIAEHGNSEGYVEAKLQEYANRGQRSARRKEEQRQRREEVLQKLKSKPRRGSAPAGTRELTHKLKIEIGYEIETLEGVPSAVKYLSAKYGVSVAFVYSAAKLVGAKLSGKGRPPKDPHDRKHLVRKGTEEDLAIKKPTPVKAFDKQKYLIADTYYNKMPRGIDSVSALAKKHKLTVEQIYNILDQYKQYCVKNKLTQFLQI